MDLRNISIEQLRAWAGAGEISMARYVEEVERRLGVPAEVELTEDDFADLDLTTFDNCTVEPFPDSAADSDMFDPGPVIGRRERIVVSSVLAIALAAVTYAAAHAVLP